MKEITSKIYVLLVVFFAISCKGIIEPDIQESTISNSLGNFTIDTISSTSRQLLVKWKASTNAVRYDVIINDTIAKSNALQMSCLLSRLEPNTDYKVSVRAYDKNNYTKTVSKYTKTTSESLNEITALSFGRYDYQLIHITHCKVTKDNNYIILADAFIYDKTYKVVLKTDKEFNIIWKYNYEGGIFDDEDRMNGQDIKECSDGGFLIISRNFIFKVSKKGEIVYNNKYTMVNYAPWINTGIQTSNGNYLFVGTHYWMLNSNSDTLWVKKKNFEKISDLIQNDAGNYFVYGYINQFDSLGQERYFIKLSEIDVSGNILNDIIYKIADLCSPKFLLASNDNGYYMLSHSTFTYYAVMSELCVTKTNNKGKELWTLHTYPELNMAVTVNSARVLPDNSVLCLCYNSVSQDYFVYEISPDGKITKKFRAGDMYVPIFVDKDENGKYIILTRDGYIYKLSSER